MRYVVDRIEENVAVLENESGTTLTIPAKFIEDASEGDTVVITVEKKSEDDIANTHSVFEKLRNK